MLISGVLERLSHMVRVIRVHRWNSICIAVFSQGSSLKNISRLQRTSHQSCLSFMRSSDRHEKSPDCFTDLQIKVPKFICYGCFMLTYSQIVIQWFVQMVCSNVMTNLTWRWLPQSISKPKNKNRCGGFAFVFFFQVEYIFSKFRKIHFNPAVYP